MSVDIASNTLKVGNMPIGQYFFSLMSFDVLFFIFTPY